MRKIVTNNSRKYGYCTQTNKIYLWDDNYKYKEFDSVEYLTSTELVQNKISMFTVELTQQCNLRCSYCCYSGDYRDRRMHNSLEISWETLRHTVNFIQRHSDSESPKIVVCFYGGEALLALDKMKWVISELRKSIPERYQFSISTNGLLLTENIVDWICSIPDLVINITINGDHTTHDANRKTAGGKGSFSVIMNNLTLFKQKYSEEYDRRIQFLSTVHSCKEIISISDYWETNPLLKNHRPVHISYVIPNFDKKPVSMINLTWVKSFYNRAREDLRNGKENIITDELQRLVGKVRSREFYELPSNQRFVTCLHNLYSCFITARGDLYACEKFCSKNKVGNVYEGVNDNECRILIDSFLERKNKYCSSCWANRLCRICATNLNHTDEEFNILCDEERVYVELALQYYCEVREFEMNKGMP